MPAAWTITPSLRKAVLLVYNSNVVSIPPERQNITGGEAEEGRGPFLSCFIDSRGGSKAVVVPPGRRRDRNYSTPTSKPKRTTETRIATHTPKETRRILLKNRRNTEKQRNKGKPNKKGECEATAAASTVHARPLRPSQKIPEKTRTSG